MNLSEIAEFYRIKESAWKESENLYDKIKTGGATCKDYNESCARYELANLGFVTACRSHVICELVEKGLIAW